NRDVRVVSQQGVVVLSGNVDSDQEKSTIEQFAQSTDGVKQVIDQLAVSGPEQAAEQAPAQPQRQATRRPSRSMAENGSSGRGSGPAPVVQSPPGSSQQASDAPPPPPADATIPAGTVIAVRLVDSVDTRINKAGDEIKATVDSQIADNGQIVIPRYSKARLRVVSVRNAGHIKGQSMVELKLVSVTVNGQAYNVNSGVYQREAKGSRGKQTAERAGIGAAVGGIIGAIAGGGKGAAIGAGVGAGAGTGVQMATKAPPVEIPSETKIDFTLTSPLTVAVN
ncbi:MAG TPA: BON domain-containing protein, partial [Terriglobia bacterium]|nr:BON domain-containing protein [Terriglobia bacterium]